MFKYQKAPANQFVWCLLSWLAVRSTSEKRNSAGEAKIRQKPRMRALIARYRVLAVALRLHRSNTDRKKSSLQ